MEKKTIVIPLLTASEHGTGQTESPVENAGGDVVFGRGPALLPKLKLLESCTIEGESPVSARRGADAADPE